MKNEELKENTVEKTLCFSFWCLAVAAKKLPELLPDYDAIEILEAMGEKKAPSVFYHLQCAGLTGAMRQYDFSVEISDDLSSHPKACVVELGAGLSCLCLRRKMKNESNPWYSLDLEDVIACRNKCVPSFKTETNLICDLNDPS